MSNDGCIRGGLALLGRARVVVLLFQGPTPSEMKATNYGMSTWLS